MYIFYIYICNIYLHIGFSFFMIIMFYKVTTDSQQVQKYCGNSVSVVPDHCNKSNTTVMQVIWLLWLPSTYKSYIYSMNCALPLCLRKQYTCLNWKVLCLKNASNHLSLQSVVIFWWLVISKVTLCVCVCVYIYI